MGDIYSYKDMKTRQRFYCWLLELLLITGALMCQATVVSSNNLDFVAEPCPELQTQRDVDLAQVSGTWYVVEAVQHSTEVHRRITPKGNLTCAILNIQLVNDTTVYLKWKQQFSPTVQYVFDIKNETSPGVWIARESPWIWPQGTPFEEMYVMKAVSDHLVLTFCQPGSGGHVFTAVIGRHNVLTFKQIQGVNAMLQRRGLETVYTNQMSNELCQKNKIWAQGSASPNSAKANGNPSLILSRILHVLLLFICIFLI